MGQKKNPKVKPEWEEPMSLARGFEASLSE